MGNGCVRTVEVCVTKGTRYEIGATLSTAYTEVIENISGYEGVLVFREYQDDAAPVYLTLRVDVVEIPPDTPAIMNFVVTPDQSAALPDHDHVGYCNLRSKDAADGYTVRLFDMEVKISE